MGFYIQKYTQTFPGLVAVLIIMLALCPSTTVVPSSELTDTLVSGKTDMTDTLVTTRNFKPELRQDTESV